MVDSGIEKEDQKAKGVQKHRHLVRVSLSSARKKKKHDSDSKQYYFMTGKKRKQRTPTNGYFEFNFNLNTEMKEPVTLYTELLRIDDGEEYEVLLEFKERNTNPFKVDQTNTSIKLSLKTGEKRRMYTINEDDLELRVHLAISRIEL